MSESNCVPVRLGSPTNGGKNSFCDSNRFVSEVTSAHEGAKFTMLGELDTRWYLTSRQRYYEDILLSARNTNEASPVTIESTIAAPKKGVDFFVIILARQPIDEVKRVSSS